MDDDSIGWINMTAIGDIYETEYHPQTDRWRHRTMRMPDFHSRFKYRVETDWFPGKAPKS